ADAMATYDWPGNVRELERTIERAVALTGGDVIELADLPAAVRGEYSTALGPSLQRSDKLRTWASRYVRLMVDSCHGNRRAASRALGISYHTLQGYLRAPLIETQPPAGSQKVDIPEPVGEEAGIPV